MRTKHSIKSVLSGFLAAVMTIGAMPAMSVSAAQVNEYIDPADVWITSNGRTNELDFNATITQETGWCPVCVKDTIMLTYRTPEYTKSGETALNRGVKYSDGTMTDGVTKGNLDYGRPGMDASYSTYHWTKSVCQTCGTINSIDGEGSYSFSRNVYGLNSCDLDFFLDFDNTTYTPYDSEYHTTTLKKGQYCQFCKGTKARATDKRDRHNVDENIDGELGNQRFHITGECDDCGYNKSEYVAAKSVVQSYYGKVDGKAHTVTVSDLSENGVHTKIRYGTQADQCNKTSAPNYTEEGYYPIYYEIDYSYDGENMTENGVSYVWLLADNSDSLNGSNNSNNSNSLNSTNSTNSVHTHDYRYLETVRPTCTELGYDRFQCSECGALQKTNYVPSTGHNYSTVVIRSASCQQGGLELHSCKNCGSFYTESTSMTDHHYQTNTVPSTCTMNGYTEHTCIDCGYRYITDLTPLTRHDYRDTVTVPTCTTRGFTTHACADCDDIYISDYTEAKGHEWDNGRIITSSTCDSEGVKEFHCRHCDEKMIQAVSSTGHKPGAAATCTEAQTCKTCGAVLKMPTGHHYSEIVTPPSCSAMGFTTFTCNDCGTSYIGHYTDKTAHHYHSIITPATCTEFGYTTYTCTECGDEYKSDYADKTEHHYHIDVTAPTCTAMGYSTYTCHDCGVSFAADYTDVVPHNYRKEVIVPTCTEQGYTVYTCPDCGKEFIGDEKEPIEHSFNAVVTEPMCEEMGFTTYTCDDCRYSYIADYTNPTGHHYDEVITAPTCTEIGYTTYTCVDCGKSYTGNETAKIEHDYDKAVTEPTCTAMGFTVFTCKDCGDTYTGDYTDVLPHNYKEVVTAPTCSDIGFSTFTCEDCGKSYQGNETAKIPHNYDKAVTEPTCTAMGFTTYTCPDCGDTYTGDYTDVLPHNYKEVVTAPTCSEIGFSTFTCEDCGKSYQGNETAKIPHNYDKAVTEPTCTAMGFTVFTCKDCGDTYTADYTDVLPHNYKEVVTAPTCSEIGFSTFTCEDCGKSYQGNETAKIPHNYDKAVTEPTCTSMGFTVFTCKDCGDTYTADYTDMKGHDYETSVTTATCTAIGYTTYTCKSCGNRYIADETAKAAHNYEITVTDPTCTELGYSTYTCPDCGETYRADETAKAAHNYEITITDPTCTELGYSTYTCSDCGETYRADEIAAKGHSISDWIIDIPATIEYSGEKHKECTVCGEVLENAEIPQLADKDNSDEDGHSNVGDYSILITDKNNKPIFDSEISIDKNDNITIILPNGRLLSTDDITTITVTRSETQQPACDINIFIADKSNNAATGKTDANGQLSVPNAQSSTGSSNGTVADSKNTYVVVVTDKNGTLIPDCGVTVGENFSIDVKLPHGTAFDRNNRITVTTVTEKGEPIKGLRVQLIGDGDFVENGYTNINGQITLPMSNSDITDENGKGEVGEINGDKIYDYIVTVYDEKGLIKDALITMISDDNSVLVCLPHGNVIDYFNRTTVKVTKADGTPVEDWKVSVYNKDGSGLRTEITDEDGIVIVPPLSEAPISKPTPTPNPDEEIKPLPGVEITPAPGETDKPKETEKPIGTDNPSGTDKPSKTEKPSGTDKPSGTNKPSGTDKPEKTEKPLEIGKPTEKPAENPADKPIEPTPTPDLGDGSVVQNKNYKYSVYVWDNDGVITEFGLIKLQDNGDLIIELPENRLLDESNKTYVKVVNDNDGTAVKAITVNVSDVNGGEASDITNSYGIAVVPVSDTDTTDIKGNAQVKDNEGNLYNVNVSTDEKGAIEGAVVNVTAGKITVTLPDGTIINYKDRTTVTVSDRDNKPVSDIHVNVKDTNGSNRTENTDKNGAVVVPPRNEFETDNNGDTGEIPVPTPTPNPDATPEPSNEPDDPNFTPTPTEKPITKLNVKVEDESGIIRNAVVVRGDNNEITVKLPDGKVLDKDNRIKVTVANQDNEPLEGINVTVNDSNGNTDSDTTNKLGYIIVPVIESDNTDGNGGVVEDNKDDVRTQYTVIAENSDGRISGAVVTIADGKISVKLPDTHTLTTANQTKITVLDKDAQPVKGISVTVEDKDNKTASKTTDADGQILVPVKTSGSGGGSSSGGGGGSSSGGSYISADTTNVKVTDRDGKTVDVSKSIDKDGKVTLTLPAGKTLDGDNYYTIVTTDKNGKAKTDVDITIKDKNGNSVDGTTDKDGKLILPTDEHKSYIVGYTDGTFKPEGNMTRAEAAAIFARIIAERKGENISNSTSSFTDVGVKLWYNQYISYLEKYDIIKGYEDGTFKPDAPVTRAEFVTMCARFYNLFDKTADAESNKFTDAASSHWAYKFINSAAAMNWITGYTDGSFKPDNNITRAEVVAVVNRVTGRIADTEYISKNLSKLNRFDDLSDTGYWAYYPIIEAANTHKAVTKADGKTWVK